MNYDKILCIGVNNTLVANFRNLFTCLTFVLAMPKFCSVYNAKILFNLIEILLDTLLRLVSAENISVIQCALPFKDLRF